MGRVIGLDFGTKRTGIAVTDPLQIVVNPLNTLPTPEVLAFLKEYIAREPVDLIVCGHPGTEDKDTQEALNQFVKALKDACADTPFVFQDETLSSRRASRVIYQAGVKKMRRRDKGLVDQVSAMLILQEYLGHSHDMPTSL